MKKIIFFLLAFSILACSRNECDNNLFNTKTFRVDNEVCINGIYYFNINEVIDTRCPQDVTCVWEGDVTLVMSTYPKVGQGPASIDSIIISDSNNSMVYNLFELYKAKIESINPYPKKDKIILQEEYIIKMSVSEK